MRLQTHNIAHKCFHASRAVLTHIFGVMSVPVKCKCGCCMPKIALYRFHVITSPECCHSIGAPVIVESEAIHTNLLANLACIVRDSIVNIRAAKLIGEYQTKEALIVPQVSSLQSGLSLTSPLFFEHLHYHGAEVSFRGLSFLGDANLKTPPFFFSRMS